MTRVSDFRSDTVTRPDDAMRAAMAAATVGDDVFRDDPTALELERRTAALFEREAALFLPSGTMANQAAVGAWCRAGDEVLLEEGCHTFRYEQAGLARLHGVQAVALPGEHGRVPVDAFAARVRSDDPHHARTRLVVVENTHNRSGGSVLPLDYLADVRTFADRHALKVHMDGARALNAAVALDRPVADVAACADSVTLCLSKGIGAPVGTMLIGDEAFIGRALRMRKLFGGGLRQVGVLAAPALRALEEAPRRIARDHARAQRLAAGLAAAGLAVKPPETNIVLVEVPDRSVDPVVAAAGAEGVLVHAFGPGCIRLVTHRDVDDEDVDRAVAALAAGAEETP